LNRESKIENHQLPITNLQSPISIITPSYNQAAYLEQTIRSVLGQGMEGLEYIIVDGGSTDESVAIIEKYADQLAWWVSEPDKGQADAINKGFRRATGEYIAWLNSDDMYAPGAVAEAIAFLDAHPDVGLVYGNAASMDPAGRPLNDMVFADWGLPGLMAFNIICQPAVFMRRSALEAAGYLDETYHFMLDHQLWLRVAQKTKIQHVPKLGAFARHHPNAKNVAQAPGFGREALQLLAWMPSQAGLAPLFERDRPQIEAAAHRFNGRYLLDGGQPLPSIRAYLKALRLHPQTALQEGHRILFAALSLIGLGKLGEVYYRMKAKRLPKSVRSDGIENVAELYQD